MKKIKWDLEKEKFLPETTTVLICNHCGWLIQNPSDKEERCDNCKKSFKDTNSKIYDIKRSNNRGK